MLKKPIIPVRTRPLERPNRPAKARPLARPNLSAKAKPLAKPSLSAKARLLVRPSLAKPAIAIHRNTIFKCAFDPIALSLHLSKLLRLVSTDAFDKVYLQVSCDRTLFYKGAMAAKSISLITENFLSATNALQIPSPKSISSTCHAEASPQLSGTLKNSVGFSGLMTH